MKFQRTILYKVFFLSCHIDAVLEQEAIYVKTFQMCAMFSTHVQQWVHVEIILGQHIVPAR